MLKPSVDKITKFLSSFISHSEDEISKSVPSQIDTFADNYRCDVDLLKSILEDFDLFRIEDGCYVSDRVLRDLSEQEKKVKTKKEASSIRWLLSSFNKAYVEFFGEEPILQPSEIESLKKYNEKIPDLKAKLRDILYTLKNLKFDTDTKFKPCANWLLKENNLARLVNGEFGKLQHKKTAAELRAEAQAQETQNEPSELELEMERISSKAEAIQFIIAHTPKECTSILPYMKPLMKKFDITERELKENK